MLTQDKIAEAIKCYQANRRLSHAVLKVIVNGEEYVLDRYITRWPEYVKYEDYQHQKILKL